MSFTNESAGHFPQRCYIGQDGQLYLSATDAITATASGTQATAAGLLSLVNRITTVATAADAVELPLAQQGLCVVIINSGTKSMQVFGAGTDTINDIATATGISQMPNSISYYICTTAAPAGKWYTDTPGNGYSLNFPTQSATDAMTASATQTQAAGTPITTVISRFTTVASNNNACTLPVSAPGMELTIINAHASNAIQIFPNAGGTTTEQINALGANAAFSLAATKVVTIVCTVAGQWHTQLTA